jgi:DNA-binding transcriptional LysR family regulator
MKPSFDWHLLPVFMAIHEHGSLLAAARHLGLSQPTVGRQLAELERQWGAVLFERTGRGLLATDSAQMLLPHAKRMAQEAAALERSLSQSHTTVAGTVRISASQPVACVLLPPILARLQQQLPEIQIELVSSNSVSNLLEREADIALRMVRPEQESLVAKRIALVRMTPCASQAYLQQHGTPLSLAELSQHRLIGLDQQTDMIDGFKASGWPVTREHFAFRTDDFVAYSQAVAAGLGVGFMARYLAASLPQVVRVLADMPMPSLPVWLTVHREIRTSPRIRAVYDALAETVPQALQISEQRLLERSANPASPL